MWSLPLINKQNTMIKRFKIIPVEDEAVMVDKNVEVELNDWIICDDSGEQYQTVNHNKIIKTLLPKGLNDRLWVKIIAHTGIESLKDSNLPLFEIPDNPMVLAREAAVMNNYDIGDDVFKHGFVLGYKAAGGHTGEQVKLFERTREALSELTTLADGYENNLVEFDLFLKSLKKYPVSADVEVVDVCDYDDDSPVGYLDKPIWKLPVKNNHIIIKQFNYETIFDRIQS
jgi:hypothetical protein